MWRLLHAASTYATQASEHTGAQALELFVEAAAHADAARRSLRGDFCDVISVDDRQLVESWLTGVRNELVRHLAGLA